MKKIIFLFLFSNFLFAQGGLKLTAGPNFSSFLNDKDAEMYIGYTFGVQYEYYLSKKLSVTSGLQYSKEGGVLRGKITKPSVLSEGILRSADIFYEDIHAIIGYLKIPIIAGYSFEILKNNFSQFIIGGSLLIPIKDFSTSDNYRFAFKYYVGETKYDFEYYSTGAESFFFENDFNASFDVGFKQNYKKFNLEFSMNYHIFDFGYVYYISEIKKNLISGKLLIGYNF